MNERIQELIRSADVHIIPDESEYGHTIIGMEKFAEMIVRECAEVSKNYAGGSMPLSIALAIKQHFGVKE